MPKSDLNEKSNAIFEVNNPRNSCFDSFLDSESCFSSSWIKCRILNTLALDQVPDKIFEISDTRNLRFGILRFHLRGVSDTYEP